MSFYIFKIITLLGGLALFLFGMDIMGNSLEKMAGKDLSVRDNRTLNTLLYAISDIEPLEQVVDSLIKEIKARHVRRLRDGMCNVEYGFVLKDLLTAYGRTADHCSNVAVEMLQVAEGKLEAHEYLGALKAGELEESAQFTKRFQAYKEKYAFDKES